MRYILHSDLNNFYASVECLYNPAIRDQPVVVVGDIEKRHGIVLAKNIVAKKYGIATGEPLWQARQKCDRELVCVPVRFDLYKKISKSVKQIYARYTNKVESFGIDEAWLDVTDRVKSFEQAKNLADTIRQVVFEEIGLTVSVGVSFNKTFAKLGSDMKKPNATTLIEYDKFKQIVWPLDVGELLYVGKRTKEKLNKVNINTIGDLANADFEFIKLLLGKVGIELHRMANGLEENDVKFVGEKTQVKSIGNSLTCPRDLKTMQEVKSVIYILSENVARRMREQSLYCQSVSIGIKDGGLESFDRQVKLHTPTNLSKVIAENCIMLFEKHYTWNTTVRAIGVRASDFNNNGMQFDMFNQIETSEKNEKLEKVVENIRKRFGYNSIKRAAVLGDQDFNLINPEDHSHTIHPTSFLQGKIKEW